MKKEFVVNWFAENSTCTREEIEKDLSVKYFEQSLIDSFAFLNLIAECEEKFGIAFSDDDFSKDEIFTISGFISILENE